MVDRQKLLNVRMTEAEMAMVKGLAGASGLSQSDVIRQLVRKAYAELARGDRKRPKPQSKK